LLLKNQIVLDGTIVGIDFDGGHLSLIENLQHAFSLVHGEKVEGAVGVGLSLIIVGAAGYADFHTLGNRLSAFRDASVNLSAECSRSKEKNHEQENPFAMHFVHL